MKTYNEIKEIHAGLMGNNPTNEEIVESIDRDSEIVGGFWNFANNYNALDEGNCEAFAIAHMTEYNKLFGPKY